MSLMDTIHTVKYTLSQRYSEGMNEEDREIQRELSPLKEKEEENRKAIYEAISKEVEAILKKNHPDVEYNGVKIGIGYKNPRIAILEKKRKAIEEKKKSLDKKLNQWEIAAVQAVLRKEQIPEFKP